MWTPNGRFDFVKGFWSDAGTIPSREVCDSFVRQGLEREILKALATSARIGEKLKGSFGRSF